ncbi:MAG: hypothetical protein U1U88_000899 [Lawsonella clevelandensis]
MRSLYAQRPGGCRWTSAGALLLSLLLSGSLLTACGGAESRFQSISVKDFLVTEKELPQGFSASPIVERNSPGPLKALSSHHSPSVWNPRKPGWLTFPQKARAGEYLEYPASNVVIALMVVRPAGSLPRIDGYLKDCQRFTRKGSGVTLRVTVTPYEVSDRAVTAVAGTDDANHHTPVTGKALGVRGYQERLAMQQGAPVSSTYLYADVRGVGVIAILRSRNATPTRQQTASLNAILRVK